MSDVDLPSSVTGTIRGPEPPFVGAVYVARTKSGRRWEVWRERGDRWGLWPLGRDVHGGGGGVRAIERTTEELRDRKKWRMVGVTRNAINV